MELKKGYKQTEVGVIPNDWDVKKLGLISDIKTGPFGSSLHEKDYVIDGIPIITVEHLSDYGIIEKNTPMVSVSDWKRLISYVMKTNDIVFSRVGSVDRNSLITKKEAGWLFSGRLLRIRIINNNTSSKYLSYHFQQETFKQRIRSVAVGQTMASLNTKILKEISVILPPTISEQTVIAFALSDADGLITNLEKLIAKKRLIKQGTMQQLLKPKKGWEVKKLGEICNYQNGTSLEKYFNNKDGFKVISIGNYSTHGKFVITNSFIDKKNQHLVNQFILKKNDLTMILNDKTSIGAIIGRVLLIDKDDDYVFNQRTMRLTTKSNASPFFLYHLINSNIIHNKIVASSKPGTQIYVNTSDIIDLELEIPSIDEQNRIATILSDMDAELSTLEQKLEKYKKIKLGMMQELLTGKVRLV